MNLGLYFVNSCSSRNFLVKILLVSSCANSFIGAIQLKQFVIHLATRLVSRSASGPIIIISGLISTQKLNTLSSVKFIIEYSLHISYISGLIQEPVQ